MESLKQEEARLGALIQACTESPEQGRRFDEIHELLNEAGDCWDCAEIYTGHNSIRCGECQMGAAEYAEAR
jgi:hypothetical protein